MDEISDGSRKDVKNILVCQQSPLLFYGVKCMSLQVLVSRICLFTLLTPKMYNSWCKQPEMAMWLCPLQKPCLQLIHLFYKCVCYYPAFERIREVIVFTTSCECRDKLIQLDLSYLFFFFNHIWDVVITLVSKQLFSSAELFILAIIFIPYGFFYL